MGKEKNPKAVKEVPTEPKEDAIEESKKELPDFMKLLESPMAQGLLGGCKDIFKKKEVDPNILEITIKGPSEAVLKIMGA